MDEGNINQANVEIRKITRPKRKHKDASLNDSEGLWHNLDGEENSEENPVIKMRKELDCPEGLDQSPITNPTVYVRAHHSIYKIKCKTKKYKTTSELNKNILKSTKRK